MPKKYNQRKSYLLIDDYPLLVSPKLAEKIGLEEAIFAQQLHYLCSNSANVRDGEKWVYNTYQQWHDTHYRFWSAQKIQRIVGNLEKLGVIISTQAYNKMPMDKTKWYRVNYDSQVFDYLDNSNLNKHCSNLNMEHSNLNVDYSDLGVEHSDLNKDSVNYDSQVFDYLDNSNLNKHCSDLNMEHSNLNVDCSNLNELLPKTFNKDFQQRKTTTTPAPAQSQPLPAETPTTPAACFDDPTAPVLPSEPFAMHLAWEPADPVKVNAALHRAGLPTMSDELVLDAALDFVAHWTGKPDVLRTAAEWDMAMVKSAVQYCRKYRHTAAPAATTHTPAVSKTAQKTAWLRDAGKQRLAGNTSGKLKPVIFASICEGLAQMLETGASKGAPMLEGLPAVLAQWENNLAGTLANDANGERVLAAFAALIGQGEMFPTVPQVVDKLPPLLPQYRAQEPTQSAEEQAADRKRAEAKRLATMQHIERLRYRG